MFVNLICWAVIGLITALITARAIDQRGDDPKLGIMLGAAAIGAVLTMIGWQIVRRAAS